MKKPKYKIYDIAYTDKQNAVMKLGQIVSIIIRQDRISYMVKGKSNDTEYLENEILNNPQNALKNIIKRHKFECEKRINEAVRCYKEEFTKTDIVI